MQAINERLKREGETFLDAIRKASEPVYLILLSLYVLIYLILKTTWDPSVGTGVGYFRYGLLSVVMWGGTLYLFFVIVSWKKLWKNTLALILIGGALLACTGYFSTKMSTNSYGVVFDIFFCLMAAGKDYKKILRCILYMTLLSLLVAAIGVKAGFTWDMQKPENISPGHSLGINYPNTWGYIAFLAMMLIWYLRLRNRPILTCVFFWAITAFMYFYISCRTIALLSAVFPVAAMAVDALERWSRKRMASHITVNLDDGVAKKESQGIGIIGWIVTAMPFLAFAFMLALSMSYQWVHKHFYDTKLYSMAMRFVQGGLYFKTYGMPIFGNPYRSNQYTYVNVNGSFEKVGILDSSFASYIIMRGMFWLTYTLLWLSYAIWKALKRKDYAIPFLTAIILVFAMMERPGLEMWYCFILLYPLAKVADDPLDRQAQTETAEDPEPECACPTQQLIEDEIDTGTEMNIVESNDETIE